MQKHPILPMNTPRDATCPIQYQSTFRKQNQISAPQNVQSKSQSSFYYNISISGIHSIPKTTINKTNFIEVFLSQIFTLHKQLISSITYVLQSTQSSISLRLDLFQGIIKCQVFVVHEKLVSNSITNILYGMIKGLWFSLFLTVVKVDIRSIFQQVANNFLQEFLLENSTNQAAQVIQLIAY